MEFNYDCFIFRSLDLVKKIINFYLFIYIVVFMSHAFAQTESKGEHSQYVWRSLMVPGWGEFSLNEYKRGKFFFITESILWIGMGSSFLRSNLEKQTFESYAREHAGISSGSKPRQFWIDIGNYDRREEFIAEHLRWRDYDAVKAYEDVEWDWNWNSEKQRNYFESIRIKSDRLILMGKFFIGGIVLNHIVSGIDVLYLSRIKSNTKINLSLNPMYEVNSINVNMVLSISLN